MTVAMFITLLTAFATLTGVIVEAIKKVLDEKGLSHSSNLMACVTGCIVGIGGTACYYILCSIPFNAVNIVCMILMGIASALGSMVGYDKIIQTIKQIKGE